MKSFDTILITILKAKALLDQRPPQPPLRLEGNRVSLKELGRVFLNEVQAAGGPESNFANGAYPTSIMGVQLVESPKTPPDKLVLKTFDDKVFQVLSIKTVIDTN